MDADLQAEIIAAYNSALQKGSSDGRRVDEIRPLDAEIDFLPKVHGSGLFTRGQTQALSVLTLAPMSDTQLVDGLDPEYKKRFLHHYNFPQYSVGETGRYGAPGRREIGHGALGERALAQVLPSVEEFPYAIRLVAEVLESNGSSSQASICAGTWRLSKDWRKGRVDASMKALLPRPPKAENSEEVRSSRGDRPRHHNKDHKT